MANFVGMDFTNAHQTIVRHGWHLIRAERNSSVIFNVYCKGNSTVTFMIDRNTLYIAEVC